MVTSPRQWWNEMSTGVKGLKINLDGYITSFVQSRLDPCWFILLNAAGDIVGQLCSHVDDFILCVPPELEFVRDQITQLFGLSEWDELPFTYCGCRYESRDGELFAHQAEFVQRRMPDFKVTTGPPEVTEEERIDNMSAVGSLSWLSSQTRPDLSCCTWQI